MSLLQLAQTLLLVSGAGFFLVGAIGLLRLPDTYTRIHALTKVDNLGLGLVIIALLPSAPSIAVALKLFLIWLLALAASSTAGHLVAQAAHRRDRERVPGDDGVRP